MRILLTSATQATRVAGFFHGLLGDINGDGLLDFVVSETERDLSEGNIYAQSGLDGTRLWFRTYGGAWHFGHRMAAIGDIDGDGRSDLLVGSCSLRSNEAGMAAVLSGKTGAVLFDLKRKGDDVISTRHR